MMLCGLFSNDASAQLYARPVANPPAAYKMDGYEFTVPPGSGWFELKREKHYVYFGKRLSSPTHSFIAVVLAAPIEESFETVEAFRDHVARQLGANPGDVRSKITAVSVEVDTSPALPTATSPIWATEDWGATSPTAPEAAFPVSAKEAASRETVPAYPAAVALDSAIVITVETEPT